MRRLPLALPILLVVIPACGSDDDTTATSSAVGSDTATGAPTGGPLTTSPETIVMVTDSTDPPNTPGLPSGSDEERAIADLAAREGVDPAAITTVAVDGVMWRDGSIGCPEEGMLYTQALVPGVRVILELDGASYEYHAGGGRELFLCETPEPPVGE